MIAPGEEFKAYLKEHIYKTARGEGCWFWQVESVGGLIPVLKQPRGAQRLVYWHRVGPIADGDELDPICGTPACVRPSHLEPFTPLATLERRYLDTGVTPERAHELAVRDQEAYALRREQLHTAFLARVKVTVAISLAKRFGVKVGSRLRRTKEGKGEIWEVTAIDGERGFRVIVVSEKTGLEDALGALQLIRAGVVSKKAKQKKSSRRK